MGDSREISGDPENVKQLPISSKDEEIASSEVMSDPTTSSSEQASGHVGAAGPQETIRGSNNGFRPPNIVTQQAVHYGGYKTGPYDERSPFLGSDNIELQTLGMYNDNASVLYHPGYGYSPQMPYGPYSPATTPLPPEASLYPSQQFTFSSPYFPQTVPPSIPFIASPTHVSQMDLSMTGGFEQQAGLISDASIKSGTGIGSRAGYSSTYVSLSPVGFATNSGFSNFYNSSHGYDGFGWSDSTRSSDYKSMSSLPSSPPQFAAVSSYGHNVTHLTPGSTPTYGYGAATSSYNGIYGHGGTFHNGLNTGRTVAQFGNNTSWMVADKGIRRTRGASSLCSCNGALDVLSEKNRGPRASKQRNLPSEHEAATDSSIGSSVTTGAEVHNRSDFEIEYEDAKFFVIKSYSEDNVHKSIKYGVWASTPNGNKKLDSAFHDAMEKGVRCPIFLLFSVNASAHFCGVAEMMGPVDFEKSVDYWQQDKWSGQFPVKWHILKDVPNSLFRHIILENNDNKPVTNSRDTQEVKLEQGIEILKIFKNYDSNISILDDFDYYEQREIALRKVRHQASSADSFPTNSDNTKLASDSVEAIKHLSMNFASATRLGEYKAVGSEKKAAAESNNSSKDQEKDKGTAIAANEKDN